MTRPDASARTESRMAELTRIPVTIRLAFESFLGVPTLVVAGFLLLAIATFYLDGRDVRWLAAPREFLESRLFSSPDDTTDVLTTVAGGMITVTSITFSLLLVALQQSAGSMTHAVFDQFMRRRLNQVYAGWFIGVTLYALVTLAIVDPEFNPVIGATLTLVFAIGSLYVLLLMVYAAIEQMRPAAILQSIHDHTLQARERQSRLLRRTRRASQCAEPVQCTVRARGDGFVTGIDLDRIADALARTPSAEVALTLPLGGYAAFRDPLATIKATPTENVDELARAVERAIELERERDLDADPAFGIEQIETIAWTTVSTSKQDPNPGLEASRNLRDLLARWAETESVDVGNETTGRLPVVYHDDVIERLMGTIESLTVVASESLQHQVYADTLRGLATVLDRLPRPLAERTEDVVLRSLSGLGDHVLTAELDGALLNIIAAFDRAGLSQGAEAVRTARAELAASVGQLNSRATRVPSK